MRQCPHCETRRSPGGERRARRRLCDRLRFGRLRYRSVSANASSTDGIDAA